MTPAEREHRAAVIDQLRLVGKLAHQLTAASSQPVGPALFHPELEARMAAVAAAMGEPVARLRQDVAAVIAGRPRSDDHAAALLACLVAGET